MRSEAADEAVDKDRRDLYFSVCRPLFPTPSETQTKMRILAALLLLACLAAPTTASWSANAEIRKTTGPKPDVGQGWIQCATLDILNPSDRTGFVSGWLEVEGGKLVESGAVDQGIALVQAGSRDEAARYVLRAIPPEKRVHQDDQLGIGQVMDNKPRLALGRSANVSVPFCVRYNVAWSAGFKVVLEHDAFEAAPTSLRLNKRQAAMYYADFSSGTCRCLLSGAREAERLAFLARTSSLTTRTLLAATQTTASATQTPITSQTVSRTATRSSSMASRTATRSNTRTRTSSPTTAVSDPPPSTTSGYAPTNDVAPYNAAVFDVDSRGVEPVSVSIMMPGTYRIEVVPQGTVGLEWEPASSLTGFALRRGAVTCAQAGGCAADGSVNGFSHAWRMRSENAGRVVGVSVEGTDVMEGTTPAFGRDASGNQIVTSNSELVFPSMQLPTSLKVFEVYMNCWSGDTWHFSVFDPTSTPLNYGTDHPVGQGVSLRISFVGIDYDNSRYDC